MSLLEIKNLTLGYDDAVINNISFNVEKNDFILVIGSNGVGKSTLIKGILGLIKPRNGEINYNECDKKNVGYMPQETKVDANFPASVMEVVLSGLHANMGFRPFHNKEDKKKALNVLEILKIKDLAKKSFSELSGGQRQKVLLARGWCATNNLLILDEPSNNLDSKSKEQLYDTIKLLNKNHIAILMITHDLDHDNLLGNKILSLREDKIFFGDTNEFIRRIHNDKWNFRNVFL